jgi:hypothetical protein
LAVRDSTVAGNSADAMKADSAEGGGIHNTGRLTIVSSTIAQNSAEANITGYGGGIFGSVNLLRNSIVALNTTLWDGTVPDLFGNIGTSGYNLIGNSQGGSGYAPTDLLNVDPLLGPLQDNGGPTQTMALLPGSPAIDSGDNTNAPDWDQRGPGYPRIVNGTIDRGAFEVQDTARPAGVRSALATAAVAGLFPPRTPPSVPVAVWHQQPPTAPAPADVPVGRKAPAAASPYAALPRAAVPDAGAEVLGSDWL